MDTTGNTSKDQAVADFLHKMERTATLIAEVNDKIDLIVKDYRQHKMIALCEIISIGGGKAKYVTRIEMAVGPDGSEILRVDVPTISKDALPTLGMIESAWRMVGGDYCAIMCSEAPTVSDAEIKSALGGGPL